MTLNIRWHRLVSDGKTCERCRLTGKEVEEAVEKLEQTLASLGIDVKLEKEDLTEEEFEENPRKSNMIYIDEIPLEKWIEADVGQSECCEVCGDEECRTITVEGEEYEVVPSDLIISAGLKAASRIKNTEECCPSETSCCDSS